MDHRTEDSVIGCAVQSRNWRRAKMAEWSEWMTETQPEVGMYVQVRARHRVTMEFCTQEGRLTGEFGTVMWFEGELPRIACDWAVVRWRLRIEPDTKTVCHRDALEVV
jgi:hypothetical protein